MKQLDADRETSVVRFCGVTGHTFKRLLTFLAMTTELGSLYRAEERSIHSTSDCHFASIDVIGGLAGGVKKLYHVQRTDFPPA